MAKTREPKFEEAVEELESIIAKIESGQCGLEESIAEYERGVKLLGRCQSILQVVQQRIAELTAGPGGKPQVKAAPGDEKDASSPGPPGTPGASGTPEIPDTLVAPPSADDDNPSAHE